MHPRRCQDHGTVIRGSSCTYQQLLCHGSGPTAPCLPRQTTWQEQERWNCLMCCLLTHLLSLASSLQELTVVSCPGDGFYTGRWHETFWGLLVFRVYLHWNSYWCREKALILWSIPIWAILRKAEGDYIHMSITEFIYMHQYPWLYPNSTTCSGPSCSWMSLLTPAVFLVQGEGKKCYKETHVEEKMWTTCLWLIFDNCKTE